MGDENSSPESLISRLSHRPGHLLKGLIEVPNPAKRSSIRRGSSGSSLGVLLDGLPVEILHLIFNNLDFQSLSRLSQVSLRGKAVVESLRAYRDLIGHAPYALAALAQTDLITFHSAAKLHATLLSEECTSCRQFGPCLFLPTCERCCPECLFRNSSLWVITITMAKRYFGLTKRQLEDLPTMRTIPGVYQTGITTFTTGPRVKLVTVKDAKRLGIRVYGSAEDMMQSLSPRFSSARSVKTGEFNIFKRLQDTPLEPLNQSPYTLPPFGMKRPYGYHCGKASIGFPSLRSDNTLEMGLWCRGCEKTYRSYLYGSIASSGVWRLTPPDSDPGEVLEAMEHRAWTRSDFLEHIVHCNGVRELLKDPGVRTDGE